MGDCDNYVADDRCATPEYFDKIRSMTDEEFAKYVAKQKEEMN